MATLSEKIEIAQAVEAKIDSSLRELSRIVNGRRRLGFMGADERAKLWTEVEKINHRMSELKKIFRSIR